MLERMGFECEEAGDGLAGLDKVRAGPNFELALVDWNMPVMNGLEMLQELRAEGFDRILQALDAGANEYLMKPFDEEGLADKLALIDLVEV
jgi:two-component system chemotaxis response regulator CheY